MRIESKRKYFNNKSCDWFCKKKKQNLNTSFSTKISFLRLIIIFIKLLYNRYNINCNLDTTRVYVHLVLYTFPSHYTICFSSFWALYVIHHSVILKVNRIAVYSILLASNWPKLFDIYFKDNLYLYFISFINELFIK